VPEQQLLPEALSAKAPAHGKTRGSCLHAWRSLRASGPNRSMGGVGGLDKCAADFSEAHDNQCANCAACCCVCNICRDTCCVLAAPSVQAYNAGDGKAAAEFSKRGRHYGELAKQFRQASNEEVRGVPAATGEWHFQLACLASCSYNSLIIHCPGPLTCSALCALGEA